MTGSRIVCEFWSVKDPVLTTGTMGMEERVEYDELVEELGESVEVQENRVEPQRE